MTDVYLRRVDDDRGAKVGEVPLTATGINAAFALVREWGVESDTEMSGQFRIDGDRAYFEIVVVES